MARHSEAARGGATVLALLWVLEAQCAHWCTCALRTATHRPTLRVAIAADCCGPGSDAGKLTTPSLPCQVLRRRFDLEVAWEDQDAPMPAACVHPGPEARASWATPSRQLRCAQCLSTDGGRPGMADALVAAGVARARDCLAAPPREWRPPHPPPSVVPLASQAGFRAWRSGRQSTPCARRGNPHSGSQAT